MSGRDTRGAWILGTDPASARTIATAGFDWVALDLQHGRLDDARMYDVLAATADTVPRWVRVRALDPGLIGRALDSGADGVIVPQVSSAADARAAVVATHHPPRGVRSWGPLSGYGASEREPRVAVMIETALGLEGAGAIARTPGVDLVLVGPFDLALACGTDVDGLLAAAGADPRSPLPTVRDAALAAGVRIGAFAGTPDVAARFADLGYRDLVVATDESLLRDAARRAAQSAAIG
ncbi:MAG: aldolase/citrate lyase family protein [Microbacterium sp.]